MRPPPLGPEGPSYPLGPPPTRFPLVGQRMRGPAPPRLAFFGRGPAAVSPSLPAPVDSASGDPVPDSSGEGGGIGSPRRPSPGGGACFSSVEESRPPPRSLYRPRLVRVSRLHSQRPRQFISDSPPPTTDPKLHLGSSGLDLSARRRTRYRFAATPLPQPLPLGTPASDRAVPDSPGSVRVHAVTATPAAGMEAVAGGAGTVAAPAAATPGVEPQGRPLDPAAVPTAGVEAVVGVAGTAAVLAAATPGAGLRGRPLDPAAIPAPGGPGSQQEEPPRKARETQEKLTSTTRTRHGARNWRALALPQYTTGAAKSKTECPSINQTNKDAWGGRILSDFCELCLCVCE